MNTILDEKFNNYRDTFFIKEKNYKSKKLMNDKEIAIFNQLKEIYKNEYYIFPQVCLSAFIKTDTTERKELYRFPDFLLCDFNYFPIAVIELNGKTHRDDYTHLRDTSVKLILKQSNIKLVQLEIPQKISDNTLKQIIDKGIEG